MGDPRKQKKKYRTPRHPWQKERLEDELKILGRYGLRNKREIWKFKTKVDDFRSIAKSLLALSAEEAALRQRELMTKLDRIGLLPSNASLDDVLSLTIDDLLERRLQTMVIEKGLATSLDQARQFIAHGHIAIANNKITSPSHVVLRKEEDLIHYAPSSPLNNPDHPMHQQQPQE
ncbi:MAG: 30S ribosomal protein S4 [Candidatus Helarchaeota archaeon]|nr:30S ribosomal protein S4 [Candidatus Helarchaeota archaeon]